MTKNSLHRTFAKLIVALILVRIGFIVLKPFNAVSLDMIYWQEVVNQLIGPNPSNPYLTTTRLAYPPLWLEVLYFLGKISISIGIPLQYLIQSVLILAECGMVATLLYLCHARPRTILVAIVLNPIAILQSCQHLNFDQLVGLLVLLFMVFLLEFYDSKKPIDWLCACFFLGVGMLTKTIPVVLLPLLVQGARSLDRKTLLLGAALLFSPVAVGMGVILALGEKGVLVNVIQYRSIPAPIGISGLGMFLSQESANLFARVHSNVFFLVLLASLMALTKPLRELPTISHEYAVLVAAGLLIAIPTLGPGYGTQYIYWYLPLLAFLYELTTSSVRKFLMICYAVAALTYLVDYSFVTPYGALLVKWSGSQSVHSLSALFNRIGPSYMLHLPLYSCYAAFVGYAVIRTLRLARSMLLKDGNRVSA